jgi:hypothetical protein
MTERRSAADVIIRARGPVLRPDRPQRAARLCWDRPAVLLWESELSSCSCSSKRVETAGYRLQQRAICSQNALPRD